MHDRTTRPSAPELAGYRRGAARAGRYGRGLPRARRAARPPGRAEGARRAGRRGRGSASGCCASRASRPASTTQRRPDLRGGRAGRPPVHRDALRRRAATSRRCSGARARSSPRARWRSPPDRGALDAAHRARPRAPRREAEQRAARPPGRPRALLPGRLRADPERHRARSDGRPVHGDRRLRRARADPRRAGRRPRRPVRPRLPDVRVPDRHRPVRARSDVAAIFAHLEEPVPRASERSAELPQALDPVLARGMAKDPEERFESCAELVAAVGEALGLGPAAAPALCALAALGAAWPRSWPRRGPAPARGERPAPASPSGAGSSARRPARTRSSRDAVRGHPGQLVVTRAASGWPTSAAASSGATSPAPRPERITSNGEPRDLAALGGKVYVAADGRFLSGVVSATTPSTGVREDGSTCWPARWPPAKESSGRPAARSCSGSAPTRPAAQAGAASFPSMRRRRRERRVQFRELRRRGSVWALGDALDRRLWRSTPARGDPSDHRARLPPDLGRGRGRCALDHRRPPRPRRPGRRPTGSAAGAGRGRPRARAGSPPGPAPSGSSTRSTALSRGSIRATRRVGRRSASAGAAGGRGRRRRGLGDRDAF